MRRESEPDMPEISVDKVCFVVAKSRELLAADIGVEPDASNAADDAATESLTDANAPPVRRELVGFMQALDDDEKNALVALAWIGRGDLEPSAWRDAVAQAAERRETSVARYLLGMPLLPDHLEDALSAFDRSCRDFEEREEPFG